MGQGTEGSREVRGREEKELMDHMPDLIIIIMIIIIIINHCYFNNNEIIKYITIKS